MPETSGGNSPTRATPSTNQNQNSGFWNTYGTSIVSGLQQGGQSLLQGLTGKRWKEKQVVQQREWEQKMYEQQRADQRYNWQMENMYNSPEMQMERLKKAGLNPNLVYGNGATATGGSISSPQPQSASQTNISPPDYKMPNINEMYQLKSVSAQTDLTRQEIITQQSIQALNLANAIKARVESEGGSITNKVLAKNLDAHIQNILTDTEVKSSQIPLNVSHTALNDQQIRNLSGELAMKWQTQKLSLQELAATISEKLQKVKESKANIGLIGSHTSLANQQLETEKIKTELEQSELGRQKEGKSTHNISGVEQVIRAIIYELVKH